MAKPKAVKKPSPLTKAERKTLSRILIKARAAKKFKGSLKKKLKIGSKHNP